MSCNASAYSASHTAESSLACLAIKAVLMFLETILPETFAKRIVAVILLSVDTPVQRIQRLLDMGKSTVYNLKKALNNASSADEIVSLFQMKPGCGRKMKTGNVLDQIKDEINQGFYTSLRGIKKMIEDKYGVILSIATAQRIMKRLGIKRLKAASLPANAEPSLQEQFYNDTMKPLMKDAQENKLALLFMDGSHFVIGCEYLGYVYGSLRRFVRSLSGRQRYNVLGAIDYVTKKVHTVTNTKYITATQVIEMMYKLTDFYGTEMPIRIFLDNARYQKCNAVKDALAELKLKYNIELVYLPSYSPNLNLIERLWRFVKTEIRSNFITDFSSFCAKIDEVIESTTGTAKAQIDSLIHEEVQLYNSLKPVDAHSFVMPPKKKVS